MKQPGDRQAITTVVATAGNNDNVVQLIRKVVKNVVADGQCGSFHEYQ